MSFKGFCEPLRITHEFQRLLWTPARAEERRGGKESGSSSFVLVGSRRPWNSYVIRRGSQKPLKLVRYTQGFTEAFETRALYAGVHKPLKLVRYTQGFTEAFETRALYAGVHRSLWNSCVIHRGSQILQKKGSDSSLQILGNRRATRSKSQK
jgi:hypothetical protein